MKIGVEIKLSQAENSNWIMFTQAFRSKYWAIPTFCYSCAPLMLNSFDLLSRFDDDGAGVEEKISGNPCIWMA